MLKEDPLENKGYFISGRFEQFKRDIPYKPFIEAFKKLILQIMVKSESKRRLFKEKLTNALGENINVITDVIPELEMLVGTQTKPTKLPPAETQLRLNLYFQSFIKSFVQEKHPLVIFLDDVQWTDSASINLLELLIKDKNSQNLLIIGAYRDNEVGPTHPFSFLIEELKKSKNLIYEIKIKPLTLNDIIDLTSDTFHTKAQKTNPIAKFIFEKTNGNPFFIHQFIKSLYEDKSVFFNDFKNMWDWNLAAIKEKPVTTNVADLVIKKIKTLNIEAQNLLKLAACLGNTFDIKNLLLLSEYPPEKAINRFFDIVDSSFIIPLSNQYKHLRHLEVEDKKNISETINIKAKFLHDRALQAAYSLLSDKEIKNNHYKIGKYLLNNLPEIEFDNNLFDIANHLNKGKELSKNIGLLKLAEINLKAGRKAKASAAYESALYFFSVGASTLDKDKWKKNYELTFNLFLEKAESEYLNKNFKSAEHLFDYILKKSKSNYEKAKVQNIRLILYLNQSRHDEAFDAGKKALALFGLKINKMPSAVSVLIEYIKIKMHLLGKEINSLENSPKTKDEKIITIMELLMNLTAPAFYINKNLFALIILKMVNISLKKGRTPPSSYAFCTFGILLGSIFNKYKEGFTFGELGLTLNKKTYSKPLSSKLNFSVGCFTNQWRKPLQTCLTYLEKSFKDGVEYGDFVYAAYAAQYIVIKEFYLGAPLSKILTRTKIFLDFYLDTKYYDLYEGAIIFKHLVYYYQGKSFDSKTLSNNNFNELEFEKRVYNTENKAPHHSYCVYKIQSLYLLENYNQALKLAVKTEKTIDVLLGLIQSTEFYFYYALTIAALYPQSSKRYKAKTVKKIKKIIKKFKLWSENCPENFENKYLLINAELSRILGEHFSACKYYEKAIISARKNEFTQVEALANELCAKYFLEQNLDFIAGNYMNQALRLYSAWGATAKVDFIKKTYSDSINFPLTIPKTQEEQISNNVGKDIDTYAVFKSLEAMNSEVVFNNLLKAIMKIAAQLAGAQRGLIFFRLNDHLNLVSSFIVRKQRIEQVIKNTPYSKCKNIAKAVIDKVATSYETVSTGTDKNFNGFEFDLYIKKVKPKSLFCMPIMKQNRLVGILYLENNLLQGVFSSDKQNVLSILAGHMAISMENTYLFERTKNLNEQLENLNKTLEKKVTKQVEEIKKALNTAEKMSYQASFAQLTLGLAHEIRNPLSEMKGHAQLLKEDISHSKESWEDGLTKDIFTIIKNITQDQSIEIYKELLDKDYIDINGSLTKKFNPYKKNYLADFTSIPQTFIPAIKNVLFNQFIRKQTSEFVAITINNINRLVKITDTMLKYGTADSGVSKFIFTKIPEISFSESEEIWQKLIDKEIIDKQGIILKSNMIDKLIINEKYSKYQSNIIDILKLSTKSAKKELIINNILDDVITLSSGMCKKKAIKIIKHYQNSYMVFGNEVNLYQAFSNIIRNSIQSMENKSIKNLNIEITEESFINIKQVRTKGIKIAISDTGCGISKEYISRVFDPFFSTKGTTGGINVGLGLSIVLQIIKNHEGLITIESNEGNGTQIIINLPLIEE